MSTGRILVTGAARRLGRAVALELSRRGFDLVLTYDGSRDACEETAELCRLASKETIDVAVMHLPLESEDAIDSVADRILTDGIDGVVHNAARYVQTPFDQLDSEEVLLHFRVNAMAPLLLTSRLASGLRASKMPSGGSVVCIGDIHAMGRPRRNYAGYLASKGALERVVECLALELAPHVRVNGVAPGVIAWAPGEFNEDEQAKYVERIPQNRSGTLEEGAQTVCWLLLDATYVDGSIIRVDGGRFLR